MNITRLLLSVAIGFCAASCGGDANPQSQTHNPAMPSANGAANGQGNASAGAGAAGTTSKAPALEGETPPPGAQYTIYCDVVRGPDHVMQARRIKDELIAQTHLTGWHLIHTADDSTLLYGYYRTFDDKINDPAEVSRAKRDRESVALLTVGEGDQRTPRFRTTIFVPISSPDPEAPPQWNLANAPANSYWSLQVAAYQGSVERKKYAVDAVKALRDSGEEAYYFHGDTISSVCVGAWPRDAIKEQQSSSGGNFTPTQGNEVPLITNEPLPANVNPNVKDREGNRVVVQAPKLEILDASMRAAVKKYPYHAINGEVMGKKTKQGTLVPDCSFLVVVPHPEEDPAGAPHTIDALVNPNGAPSSVDSAANALLEDSGNRSQSPRRAQLPSLDDPQRK